MKHASRARTRLITIGVLTSTLLSACPWDSPEKHLARGKELAGKGNHAEAVIEFKNFLQTNPKSIEARFLMGRELLAQGNPKAAEIELQKAYDGKYPRDAVAPLLARSQYLQGNLDKVSAEVAKGDLVAPAANAELQSILGLSLFAQGKVDEALAAFRNAQRFVPGYPAAMIGEARIKATRGDLDAASTQIAEVLASDPGLDDAWVVKGDIAQLRNDIPGATAAYLEATKRAPRNIVARLDLAGAYYASDSFDLAQQQVNELKRLAPSNPGMNYMDALLAFKKKDYARAAEAVRLSLNEAPNNGAAQILAGAVAMANNQPEQAELHLQEGLRLTPRSLYARGLLTRLFLRRQDPQKADEVLRPALIAFPDNPTFVAMAGEIALQRGNFAEASTYLNKASQAAPNDARLRTQAARADFAKGDDLKGFETLENAAKEGKDALPTTALVLERLQRRQYEQAADAWKLLQAEQPNDPVTYNLRAAIDLGRKDIEAARKSLEHALELNPTYLPAVSNLAALDDQAGNLESARKRYRDLVNRDRKNVSALLASAQFEERHGAKADVIVPLLEEARRIDPAAQQPTVLLARYYAAQNQLQQATTVVQEGLARSPNDLVFQELLGQLQLRSGSVDQAIAAFRKLVTARPAEIGYQIQLGQAMLAANQVEPATQAFSAALKSRPEAYGAQASAVDSLLGANKLEQANRLLAEIRKATPKSPVLTELEGDAKFAAKQFAEAAVEYRKVLAQSPSSKVVMKLAATLQLGNAQQNAAAVLSEWMKAHPDDLTVRRFDADMALSAKDYPRAIEGYRSVLKVQPNDALVLNNLAWTLWQQKDAKALSFAEQAAQIAPDNPIVNDTLGWMLVEQGNPKRGLEYLQRAISVDPKQSDIALHVAKAQIKDGRTEAARTTLQSVVRNAPDSAQGRESKALIATLSAPSR